MIGLLSRAGEGFVVVEVGGATLVKGTLWLMGCSVVVTPWAEPGTLSCSALGLVTSWKGGAETRKQRRHYISGDMMINANVGKVVTHPVPGSLDSVLCSLMIAERKSISSSSSG